VNRLVNAERLYSRSEVLSKESPVPRKPGIYAWYFRSIPPGVPTDGCRIVHGCTLLYVGISPKAPPKNAGEPSGQTLWHRLRYHVQGNAEGSTPRLSLGCLLSRELAIKLRRVGSGKRLTFAEGEERLSQWNGTEYLRFLGGRSCPLDGGEGADLSPVTAAEPGRKQASLLIRSYPASGIRRAPERESYP